MSDLYDVVAELKALREEMGQSLERSRISLEETQHDLGGWYDSEKKEWNEGIVSKLDGISIKLDLLDELSSIRSRLEFIDDRLDKLDENLANKLDKAAARIGSIDRPLQVGGQMSMSPMLGLFISAGIIAILGTLRNWF